MTNKVEVAIAILYRDGKYLMQLRDDIPGIAYPGCWGFFGGHLEPGEPPEAALKRELLEEISYEVSSATFFGTYGDDRVTRHVFCVPLTVELEQLVLKEGWDLDLVTPEEIRRGDRYSAKAGKVCPLGRLHQLILLDFIEGKKL